MFVRGKNVSLVLGFGLLLAGELEAKPVHAHGCKAPNPSISAAQGNLWPQPKPAPKSRIADTFSPGEQGSSHKTTSPINSSSKESVAAAPPINGAKSVPQPATAQAAQGNTPASTSQPSNTTFPETSNLGSTTAAAPPQMQSNETAAAPPTAHGQIGGSGLIQVDVPLSTSLATFSSKNLFTGDATNYGDDHMGGACNVQGMPDADKMIGTAIGQSNWLGGRACGACIGVDPAAGGTSGNKVLVYVSNVCPECGTGLDFENQAFIKMTGSIGGRQKIGWRFTDCPKFDSNIQVQDLGNPSDLRINVRNMRGAIVQIRAEGAGASVELRKTATSQWSGGSASDAGKIMGSGSVALQLTNAQGKTLTATMKPGTSDWQNTSVQF